MKQTIAILSLSVALVVSWAWFLLSDEGTSAAALPTPIAATITPKLSSSDQLAELEQVPENSPNYAKAQRTIGYKIYGLERDDWAEAKRHIDLAMKASPEDPKVLEDAGRVYLKLGLTPEATDMLQRANTPTAQRILAELGGK